MRSQIVSCFLALAIVLFYPHLQAKERQKTSEKSGTGQTTDEMAKLAVGGQQLKEAGWTSPLPPYPFDARQAHETGEVYLKIVTGSDGKIARVTGPSDIKHPILARSAALYVKANWRGPALKTVIVKLVFRLG